MAAKKELDLILENLNDWQLRYLVVFIRKRFNITEV